MQTNQVEQAKIRRAARPNASAISVSDLSKSFDARTVLRGLNLQIAAGEFVAIVGRSGCGKSTLLRLLADLESPSHGSVIYGTDSGTDSCDRPGHRAADIRMMFQDARLLPWKSVLANVALGIAEKSDSAQRARAALESVGLSNRESDWPATLSGGQRQRVALARALLHTPDVLLLDEPLGALDALTRIEMQQLIQNLWQQHGFTAVLVTHDVQEALTLAERVILIEDGRVTLDLAVTLAYPRQRGSVAFSTLDAQILSRLLAYPATVETKPRKHSER